MNITNIDKYKEVAISSLDELIARVKSGEISGIALSTVCKDGGSGNLWITEDYSKSVLLIGELHCLMADLEYYEINLRKDKDMK